MSVYEVRCCCDPCKLLGYVRVGPFTHVRPSEAVVFELRPLRPPGAASLREPAEGASDMTRVREQLRLTFLRWSRPRYEFDGIVIDPGEEGYAFKSDDTPIETLRRIVGWCDAP